MLTGKIAKWIKLLSIALALIMAIQIIPMDALAQINDDISTAFSPNTGEPPMPEEEDPYILSEVENLRTETTATYLMSDGTYSVAQYENPVFYKDTEGTYQEIDNSLTAATDTEEKEQVLGTQSGPVKITFSKCLKPEKIVKLKTDKYQLVWGIESDKKKLAPATAIVSEPEYPEDLSEDEKELIREKAVSSLTYENVLPDVDLNYIVSSGSLKENIIVHKPQESYIYNFLITSTNHESR